MLQILMIDQFAAAIPDFPTSCERCGKENYARQAGIVSLYQYIRQ